jgi:hypothetical protein
VPVSRHPQREDDDQRYGDWPCRQHARQSNPKENLLEASRGRWLGRARLKIDTRVQVVVTLKMYLHSGYPRSNAMEPGILLKRVNGWDAYAAMALNHAKQQQIKGVGMVSAKVAVGTCFESALPIKELFGKVPRIGLQARAPDELKKQVEIKHNKTAQELVPKTPPKRRVRIAMAAGCAKESPHTSRSVGHA